MKRILLMTMAILLIFSCFVTTVSAMDNSIMPLYDATVRTVTNFIITDSGQAVVSVDYVGIKGETIGAVIEIVLEKRFLLVFWNEVTTWVDTSSQDSYSTYHSTYVESGTYRVKVKYQISNSTTTDVIEEELKYTY